MNVSVQSKILVLIFSLFLIHSNLWAAEHILSERNEFQFAISQYHTSRQSGQTVNIYVKYAYKPGLPISEYPDYRQLRSALLKYMEPSDEWPENTYWEVIATHIGKELMRDFPLDGISIQLYVLDNQDPEKYEPGDHGPVFTLGNIAPLDVHH